MSSSPAPPQVPKLTRSGTRRLGDEYQDVQALDTLVEWLEHNERYHWVKLEADESGFRGIQDVAGQVRLALDILGTLPVTKFAVR